MPDTTQLECNRIPLPWLLKPAILTELSSTAPQIREILKSRFVCLFFSFCIPYLYVFEISYCKYIELLQIRKILLEKFFSLFSMRFYINFKISDLQSVKNIFSFVETEKR